MKKPKLTELTLREKIGQLLLGYQYDINRKTEVDANILRTPEEKKEFLENEKYGTLWAQTGHVSMGTDMAEESHSGGNLSRSFGEWIVEESNCYKIPALTALDAEQNGAGMLFPDLTTVCGPMAISAANDEKLAFELGAAVARELRCAGVTWRWAPVVDLACRFNPSMQRSFSADNVEKQIRMGVAVANGMQSEGVAATAKHFPGGDEVEYRDSHFASTCNSSTYEQWMERQGKVFQGMIDSGVYAVMTGHKAFPAVDDTMIKGRYIPTTTSRKIVTELLKEKMGFKGVVITDGIVMGGLYSLYSYEELIINLVNAGNDVILGVKPHTGEIIEKAVSDGIIPEERINDACQRVLDMKEKLGMFEDGYCQMKYKAEEVIPKTKKISDEICRRGITLLYDKNKLLPLDKEKIKTVTIICSAHVDFFYDNLIEYMKPEFEKRGAKVRVQRRIASFDEMDAIASESDLIIYAAYVNAHQPMGMPSLYGDECRTFLYAFSAGREKSIGVSMGYPYLHYDLITNADTFINTYGRDPSMISAFVEGIYGEMPFTGVSPVRLTPDPNRKLW